MTPTTASTDQSLKTKDYPIGALIFAEYNPRQLTKDQYKGLRDSIERFGLVDPIIVNKHKDRKNIVVGGHQRIRIAQDLGFKKIPCVEVELDADREKELNIRLNKNVGEWDYDALANNFDVGELTEWGFTDDELQFYETEESGYEERKTLAEKFIVPPFSVLDARQGYWQDRKRDWLSLGIDSGEGRGENLLDYSEVVKINSGTSIFDPVLCELAYKWFMPEGGKILDPFAGGSVRGIVAEYIGYNYTGIELRAEQIESNRIQAKELGLQPEWIEGDSANIPILVNDNYDFIFSCPPYYDLEVYSDLKGELSNENTYTEFINSYKDIINKSTSVLKENRFACFVVGDIRDKKGIYRNFVSDTISAFVESGANLYNEIILVSPIGSLPIRVSRQFQGYRKVGKTHQNILVFYKGDPKKIKGDFPVLDLNYDIEAARVERAES